MIKMSKKGTGKFIAGALIGAGLGLLFAPKKGSETRECLKEKTKKLANDIKNIDKDEVVDKLNQKLKDLKKDLENLDKETALELIKEKGNMLLKKADELIDIAKEKSAPVIEKAANDIREKTINVLKGAVDKLENSDNKNQVKSKQVTTKKKTA